MEQRKSLAESSKPTFDSVDELAAYLGISRQGVYAGLRKGKIPHIRLGKRFIIPRAAVDEWLRSAGRESHG